MSSALLAGCQPFLFEKAYIGLEHPAEYLDRATRIDFPTEERPRRDFTTLEPRRLRKLEKDEIWDLTLQEAVFIALANSELIRSAATFLSTGNPLLANPDAMPSVFDSAIQETGTLFGSRGVEAALSEFDAQFTTSLLTGRSEQIQNNLFSAGGLPAGSTLTQDDGSLAVALQKRFANGGQLGVSHAWDYSQNNAPGRLFPSVFEGNVRAFARQPLLAGAGVEYTRIAGPISENIQGVTGVQQGVLIARINNDLVLADFEQSVQLLLRDVESIYWQLYLAYQRYHLEVALREELWQLWQKVSARAANDAAGGGVLAEAESHEALLQAEQRANESRDSLYSLEAQLRRLLGLPVNDGRVIRPANTPTAADVVPDWSCRLMEALALRPEIRRQKWNIKSLELQLVAAGNLNLPRLDLVASGQINGFGDNLIGDPADGLTPNNLGSAYDRLLAGKQTSWNVGVEFSTTVGRRFAHSQVRNLELRLSKARAALGQQEVEIGHELAAAFRDVDRTWLALQVADQRIAAARQRLDATADRVLPGDFSIEPVLRARESLLHAEQNFLTAQIDHAVALVDLQFRSGRILAFNNVSLREAPWSEPAEQAAEERYDARRHALPNPFQRSTPRELTTTR